MMGISYICMSDKFNITGAKTVIKIYDGYNLALHGNPFQLLDY